VTRAIKTSEETKRATTCQNVERKKFNQARREQKFVRVMHRDQTKNRIAQQFCDFRQAFSESDESDLVQSFVFNDKVKYFVTFLCDFIKRSMIYVLRVKSNTFNAFKHFQ
jgi:hypothetical protein